MKYYLYKLKTLKAHIITMFILSFASYPLFCIVFSDYVSAWAAITDKSNSDLYRNSPEYYIAEASIRDKASTTVFMTVIGAVALIALFTMGIPILMKCFGYLHKKPRADMEMTAPVTAGTRFFGNFFAGLTVYLVPHIIAVIIGSAVLGGNFGDSQTEAFCNIVKRMMIYGIMMCVLFYCTTTLIAAVCGRTRTAVIITVFMNLAVPVITFTSGVLSFRYGFGLYTGLIDEMTGKVSWLTPLGLLIRFFVQGFSGTKSDGDIGIMQLIPFLLYCAAFVAAAYFLVKHRRHERTGSAYAFRYARHVFTGTAILAVTMATATEAVLSFEDYYFRGISPATAAGITVVYIVVWLLASFGCFCAFEFAGSKGEKHRKKRFILLAPLIIGSVAVTYLSTLTQGYGAAYDIPDVSEIQEAHIYVSLGYIWLNSDGSAPDGDDSSDKNDPAPIIELHRELLSNNCAGNGEISITYMLSNGAGLTRYYKVSDEYLEKAFDLAKSTCDVQKMNFSFSRYDPDEFIFAIVRKDHIKHEEIPSTEFRIKELMEALTADIRGMKFEDAKNADIYDAESIEIKRYGFTYHESFMIYPFYTHTIEFLEQHGITYQQIFKK